MLLIVFDRYQGEAVVHQDFGFNKSDALSAFEAANDQFFDDARFDVVLMKTAEQCWSIAGVGQDAPANPVLRASHTRRRPAY